jgi:hypothetical protein
VANQEAEKRGVPFERIDYTLRAGSGGGAPLWTIELFAHGGKVATMRIAADSGAIVDQDFRPGQNAEDRTYVENDRRQPPVYDARPDERPYDGQGPDPRDGEHHDVTAKDVGEDVGNFFKRVGRHFQKRGRQLNNFFTGDR